jgi:hypothetical protein
LGIHPTDLQKAKILERSNSLRRKIDAWVSIQQLYIPSVAPLRTQDDCAEVAPSAVQDMKLHLPSSLPRVSLCNILFIQHEWDFRYAQAQETLNELRGFLLLYSHMLKSKDRHIRGQRLHTRSVKLLSDVQLKVQGSASKNIDGSGQHSKPYRRHYYRHRHHGRRSFVRLIVPMS